MSTVFRVGDQVTLLPPWDDDPYILTFQHYATVAAVCPDGYLIVLDETAPGGRTYGPFPAERLGKGWRDARGRWLLE